MNPTFSQLNPTSLNLGQSWVCYHKSITNYSQQWWLHTAHYCPRQCYSWNCDFTFPWFWQNCKELAYQPGFWSCLVVLWQSIYLANMEYLIHIALLDYLVQANLTPPLLSLLLGCNFMQISFRQALDTSFELSNWSLQAFGGIIHPPTHWSPMRQDKREVTLHPLTKSWYM